MLFFCARVALPLFSSPKLSDEIEALLFALKHHVLLGTAPKKPLEQDDCAHLLVFHIPLGLLSSEVTLRLGYLTGARSMGSQSNLLLLVLLVSLSLSTLLLRSQLDILVRLVKCSLMVAIFTRELLAELEANAVNADLVGKDLGLLD